MKRTKTPPLHLPKTSDTVIPVQKDPRQIQDSFFFLLTVYNLLLLLSSNPFVSLFRNSQPDTLASGQRYPWFVSFANNEDILDPETM